MTRHRADGSGHRGRRRRFQCRDGGSEPRRARLRAMPSSRVQICATTAMSSAVIARWGRARRALSTKSWTASKPSVSSHVRHSVRSGDRREGTRHEISPATLRGSRLVARTHTSCVGLDPSGGELGGLFDEVLAVVQDEEAGSASVRAAATTQPAVVRGSRGRRRVRDGTAETAGPSRARKPITQTPPGIPLAHRGRHGQRQPRFSNASGASERDDPLIREPMSEVADGIGSTEQRRRRLRYRASAPASPRESRRLDGPHVAADELVRGSRARSRPLSRRCPSSTNTVPAGS